MKVLVTGGAGFIGANLVRLLLEEGHQVRVLDSLVTGRREYLKGLDLEIEEGDVRDTDVLAHAAAGMDGVVHLAAQSAVPSSVQDPRHDCDLNIIGTLNVLEACRETGVSRFVFASSSAVLGRQPPPTREDQAPLPISPYGASKLAGEGYCLAYHGTYGMGTVALRFANAYGPYSAHTVGVVARFFSDIATKGEVTIDGDGCQTRDLVYVGDLCRAIELALESSVGGEVVQIATGVETSVLELAAMVRELVGDRVRTAHAPERVGDIRRSWSSAEKAQRLLGWTADTTLGDGLRRTYEWYSAA
ncbi:MAG: NAD-dependent epimerase/dehydratase family protein [Anaerolineales bacterium]|nr:MAG: NAD-dependent epimerase/dehydratase family protein [Anaerolineales bacterium]